MARIRAAKRADRAAAEQRQDIANQHGTDDASIFSPERKIFDRSSAPTQQPGLRRCVGCFTDKDIGEFIVWDGHGNSTVANRCYGCRKHGTSAEQKLRQPVRMQLPPQRPEGVW